jgi:agmatine deiminase
MPCYNTGLILEGGSIHVDGEGTLMTTAECLLNPNRNRTCRRRRLSSSCVSICVETFIWLPEGVFNDETDGHIDNMCCFVRPGEVALHWTDDENDPQYARSVAALNVLENTTDARGRKLKVWKVPSPQPLYASAEETCDVEKGTAIERTEGNRLAGSYVNYLVSNDHIIYPLLDPATDAQAEVLFRQMFPDF